MIKRGLSRICSIEFNATASSNFPINHSENFLWYYPWLVFRDFFFQNLLLQFLQSFIIMFLKNCVKGFFQENFTYMEVFTCRFFQIFFQSFSYGFLHEFINGLFQELLYMNSSRNSPTNSQLNLSRKSSMPSSENEEFSRDLFKSLSRISSRSNWQRLQKRKGQSDEKKKQKGWTSKIFTLRKSFSTFWPFDHLSFDLSTFCLLTEITIGFVL